MKGRGEWSLHQIPRVRKEREEKTLVQPAVRCRSDRSTVAGNSVAAPP